MACVPNCICLFQFGTSRRGAAPASPPGYYTGKTVEFVVGAASGGGYDIYARAVSRHLGRHIPGEPTYRWSRTCQAQEQRQGRNLFAGIAPKDGTHRSSARCAPSRGRCSTTAPRCSAPTKVRCISTANSGVRVQRHPEGQRQDQQLRRSAEGERAKFGAIGPNDSTYELRLSAREHRRRALCGRPRRAISRGTGPSCRSPWSAARGERRLRLGLGASGSGSQKADWLRDNKAIVLMQASVEPHPELTRMGVPTAFDFVKDEESRKVLELVISQTVFHRSHIAPPRRRRSNLPSFARRSTATIAGQGVPRRRREGRASTSRPLPGAKVQDVVAKLVRRATIVERARKAIRPD